MKASLFFIGLAALFAIAGCDSDPTGPTVSFLTKPPGAGSTFTYHTVSRDSTGKVDFEETFTDSVGDVGLSYYGKQNVMQIIHLDSTGSSMGDVTYFNYEANGDISQYLDLGSIQPTEPFWVTYPVQSQQTRTVTIIDTTIDISGFAMKMKAVVTMSYDGTSSMVVNDSTLGLIRIKLVGQNSTVFMSDSTSITSTAYYYFAPAIGYVGKIHEDPVNDPSGFSQGATDQTLVKYHLR